MSSSSFLQGDLTSFRKAVASNNKESIEKHLSHMKTISEAELNQALFICIENFRIDEQTDECLFLLLRYDKHHQGIRQTPTAKSVHSGSLRRPDTSNRGMQNSSIDSCQKFDRKWSSSRSLQLRGKAPAGVHH